MIFLIYRCFNEYVNKNNSINLRIETYFLNLSLYKYFFYEVSYPCF